uniref:Uncharacterized protein n=1 Tax=Meloidogyne enterolobii TaxID=390850 RepID=A0A6V7WHZ8_MELEN|nr:unnamed protein product [Meloidogyne enterolobii]
MRKFGSRPMYREPNVPPSYNFVQNCRIRGALVWFDSECRDASNHTRAPRIRQFWTKL